MNIVSEKEVNGRIIDGMKTILSLSKKDFEDLLEKLKPQDGREYLESIHFYYPIDSAECPDNPVQLGLEKTYEDGKFIGRAYYGAKKIPTYELLYQFDHILPNFDPNSQNYNRITELLKTRGIEAFKETLCARGVGDRKLIDKVFEVLSDEESFNKFLDFDNNKQEFEIDGTQRELSEYLKCLGSIFGKDNSQGQSEKGKDIYTDYYLSQYYTFEERYSEIFKRFNMDRYVNPLYEFRSFNGLTHFYDSIIRKDEEPDWEISQELREAVYNGFPEEGTLEEKVMHIYSSLCKELQYDEGYFYRDKLPEGSYEYTFSKEHLESIKPGSRITCWDFSRTCSKLINELEGDIEAVIISSGENQGHFSVGFYTDKVSAMLEAINTKSKGTNDLMKAKSGIELEGIQIVSDREGLIAKALDKVYPQVIGKDKMSITRYMRQLRSLPTEEVENDLEKKLQSFVDVMSENHIYGNEAMQALNVYYNAGFFGEKLKKAYVGRESKSQDGKDEFNRSVLIIRKTVAMEPDTTVYTIDTQSLELTQSSAQDVINKLNSGEIVYEDDEHTLPDMDGDGR